MFHANVEDVDVAQRQVKVHYTRWPREYDRWVKLESTSVLMAYDDEMSRYVNGRVLCSDEDTPRHVAKRVKSHETALCDLNRQEYPLLMPSSKLRKGTMLMLPVTYALLDRTRTARERAEHLVVDDAELESDDDIDDPFGGAGHNDASLDRGAMEGGERADAAPGGNQVALAGGSRVSHTVLRKRHAGDRGALRFGHMAVLAGADKEALGARVVINCLDARHLGTVWAYRKAFNDYLVKLDSAVGALGEILEAGEVFSPIPCEHVMMVDPFEMQQGPEEALGHVCLKRTLSEDQHRSVQTLPPWHLLLSEKTPRALCVMAELLDDQDAGDHGDDAEGAALGKRGRGRGRMASGEGGAMAADEHLSFHPRFKYEGSGRLLDMTPCLGQAPEIKVPSEEGKAGATCITHERALELYELIRTGGDDKSAEGWEQEQSLLWHDIRQSLYEERMQQLQTGRLSLTGHEPSVEQHLVWHVKDSKNSNVRKQRVAAVLERAASGLDRGTLLSLSLSLLKSALEMEPEADAALQQSAAPAPGPAETSGAQDRRRAALAKQFMLPFFGPAAAERAVDAATGPRQGLRQGHPQPTPASAQQPALMQVQRPPAAAPSARAPQVQAQLATSTSSMQVEQLRAKNWTHAGLHASKHASLHASMQAVAAARATGAPPVAVAVKAPLRAGGETAVADHAAWSNHTWKEYASPSGRKYYHNYESNVTQWDPPPQWVSAGTPGSQSMEATPRGDDWAARTTAEAAPCNTPSTVGAAAHPAAAGVPARNVGQDLAGNFEKDARDAGARAGDAATRPQPTHNQKPAVLADDGSAFRAQPQPTCTTPTGEPLLAAGERRDDTGAPAIGEAGSAGTPPKRRKLCVSLSPAVAQQLASAGGGLPG